MHHIRLMLSENTISVHLVSCTHTYKLIQTLYTASLYLARKVWFYKANCIHFISKHLIYLYLYISGELWLFNQGMLSKKITFIFLNCILFFAFVANFIEYLLMGFIKFFVIFLLECFFPRRVPIFKKRDMTKS